MDLTLLALAIAAAQPPAGAAAPAVPPAPPPAPPAAPASAAAVPQKPAPAPDIVRVTLTTAAGPIVLALDRARAPVTVANFLRYIAAKRFVGTGFYRAMRLGDGVGLVQFGTRNDPARTYPGIAHEPTTVTGLSHTDGAVAMAMGAPGTAAGDVFIVVGDLHTLDAKAGDPGFAVFGQVIEGMENVRAILAAPTSPTEGEGVMKGQMLSPPIRISTARRDAAR